MFQLRHDLRSLLLESYVKNDKKLKASSYTTGNKSGKAMSLRVQGHRTKTKIPFLYHPHANEKLLKLHSIANAFTAYYKDLYNLKDDTLTHQPSPKEIQAFLNNTNLPSICSQLLSSLNEPFTKSKLLRVINKLSNAKSLGPDSFTGEYYKLF